MNDDFIVRVFIDPGTLAVVDVQLEDSEGGASSVPWEVSAWGEEGSE